MKQVKEYVKMFSPFNNRKDLPSSIFICKKMLAFFLLYFAEIKYIIFPVAIFRYFL